MLGDNQICRVGHTPSLASSLYLFIPLRLTLLCFAFWSGSTAIGWRTKRLERSVPRLDCLSPLAVPRLSVCGSVMECKVYATCFSIKGTMTWPHTESELNAYLSAHRALLDAGQYLRALVLAFFSCVMQSCLRVFRSNHLVRVLVCGECLLPSPPLSVPRSLSLSPLLLSLSPSFPLSLPSSPMLTLSISSSPSSLLLSHTLSHSQDRPSPRGHPLFAPSPTPGPTCKSTTTFFRC